MYGSRVDASTLRISVGTNTTCDMASGWAADVVINHSFNKSIIYLYTEHPEVRDSPV